MLQLFLLGGAIGSAAGGTLSLAISFFLKNDQDRRFTAQIGFAILFLAVLFGGVYGIVHIFS
jgi:succinate dehydrogenase/fumarate reductase cytochrome b subunit